jgi:UDP-N-acetylmuramate--alanine ligase
MSDLQAGALPQRIHMVGIGGSGLSAIARVLAARGHVVSGSDVRDSAILRELSALGIKTFISHAAEQVNGAELVVISSAIPEGNPEIQAAQRAGIPVIKRAPLLGQMMAGSYGIAIAGTHGKTTTAAMISVILERLGLSPTFIVGGIIAELGTNAQAGAGQHFVIEADEYDRTFYGLEPRIAVITNIEMDHPDCYRDIEELRAAFGVFLDRVSRDGHIVACADSPELMRLLGTRDWAAPHIVTYGQALTSIDRRANQDLSPTAQFVVKNIAPNARGGVDFQVYQGSSVWEQCSLAIPGAHNALNATATLIVADLLGLERRGTVQALAGFRGALRRFELKGEHAGVLVIDDYAHHPTQVRATLAAARQRYPGRRIWAVFQPHTFSRTRALLGELATCFGAADEVIITDVYAARAHERAIISPEELASVIQHSRVQHIGAVDDVVSYLLGRLREGDVLLTLGAGDEYLIGERVLALLAR